MYYINDYKKRAIDKIIPYLIEFPDIVKIVEMSADRYQKIEDVLWKILSNYKLDNAKGLWLQIHAHNEGTKYLYTDVADDAFVYGSLSDVINNLINPDKQGYGAGYYYTFGGYASGANKRVSDEKTLRAIKSQIIQNNTNANIGDLREALKLLYNANAVRILESNPLNISVVLLGDKLELSSSDNYENIKKMLPACVSLKNIYIDPNVYDKFIYGNSFYDDSRYPIIWKDGMNTSVPLISNAITLNSKDEEYIKFKKMGYYYRSNKTINGLKWNDFIGICGEFTELNDNATLLSLVNNDKSISVKTIQNENDEFNLALNIDGENFIIDKKLEINKPYTIFLHNYGNLYLYLIDGAKFEGNYETDLDFINSIQGTNNYTRTSENIGTEPIEGDIYINCANDINNIKTDFTDFTYYLICNGNYDNFSNNKFWHDTLEGYYPTCCGQKHILFNTVGGNNLFIETKNDLNHNLTTKQKYYHYKKTRSNGSIVYFDGKSNVEYNINDVDLPEVVYDFNLDVIFVPSGLQDGTVISNFTGDDTLSGSIEINAESNSIVANLVTLKPILDEEGNITGYENELKSYTLSKYRNKFYPDTQYILRINLSENKLNIQVYSDYGGVAGIVPYNKFNPEMQVLTNNFNFNVYSTWDLEQPVIGIRKDLIIGSNKLTSTEDLANLKPFKGLLSNFKLDISDISDINADDTEDNVTEGDTPPKIDIDDISIDIPLQRSLKPSNSISYTNYGTRIITVPQALTPKLYYTEKGNDVLNNKLINPR